MLTGARQRRTSVHLSGGSLDLTLKIGGIGKDLCIFPEIKSWMAIEGKLGNS